jgi:hypothetical protein
MLKRDIVLCIRRAGTSDTPVVLPIVDDTIDISTKAISSSSTRTTLGNPQFTELMVNRGKKESTLKFTTYIKPYKSGNVALAESLLHESLFGNIVPSTTDLCMTTTDTYDIAKIDAFIIYKESKTTFSLLNAVSISANYVFDLDGIARIKWEIAGIDFSEDTYLAYTYPTEGTYVPNKWTQAHIDFPTLSTGYDLASTNFSLSIVNTIQFPYTEIVNEQFATATDVPIIIKRTIKADFNMYLKVISLDMYNDLITSLETASYLDNAADFNAWIGPCNGTKHIDITLDNVILKYPKIRMDEVTSLKLELHGTTANICYKE